MYNNSTGTYVPFENDEDYYLTNSKSQVGSNNDLGWSLSISSSERWKSRWKSEIKPKCHLRNKYNRRNINIKLIEKLYFFMKIIEIEMLISGPVQAASVHADRGTDETFVSTANR